MDSAHPTMLINEFKEVRPHRDRVITSNWNGHECFGRQHAFGLNRNIRKPPTHIGQRQFGVSITPATDDSKPWPQ
jgi:hypothetical protein